MAYNYGKTFKKNGKLVRYRYTNGRKSTKKLVSAKKSGPRSGSVSKKSTHARTKRPTRRRSR